LVLAALLTLVLRDFMRESVVVPFLYGLWIARLYVESLPQTLFWVLLIIAALIIAGGSLIGRSKPRAKARAIEGEPTGRVTQWAMRIRLGNQGEYFRARLARRLGQLALATLAHREHRTLEEIREALESGEFDGPKEIAAYLQAGLARDRSSLASEVAPSWPWSHRASPLDLDPAQIVTYLENKSKGARGGYH
jgi:hypothetical protein